MQIRIIIEHKYPSSHQKIGRYGKEGKKGVLYPFLQIKRETPKSQEPIQY
jgi:hypothetical protein